MTTIPEFTTRFCKRCNCVFSTHVGHVCFDGPPQKDIKPVYKWGFCKSCLCHYTTHEGHDCENYIAQQLAKIPKIRHKGT